MANRRQKSLLQRARWDRIFGALIDLDSFDCSACECIKILCGKNKESAMNRKIQLQNSANDTNSAVVPAGVAVTEAPPETEPPVADNSMAVFLSPSTQESNQYACDPTISEEQAMFDLAERVSMLLQADGYTVYMCNRDDNVKAKVNQGNFWGAVHMWHCIPIPAMMAQGGLGQNAITIIPLKAVNSLHKISITVWLN